MTDKEKKSVLLVEDQDVIRMGLGLMLENSDFHVVGEAGDGETALKEALRLKPDVVLMDIHMPGMNGIDTTWCIKRELPHTRILIFTIANNPENVIAALGSGADGFCLKDSANEHLLFALMTIAKGDKWIDPALAKIIVDQYASERELNREGTLSETEFRVFELVSDGRDKNEIAELMNMPSDAVTGVISAIIRRFSDLNGQDEAIRDISLADIDHCASDPGFLDEWWVSPSIEARDGLIFADKYLFEESLGYGGLGIVFKARHLYMDRSVAVKVLKPEYCDTPQVARSFQQEAEAIASLQHKNIVTIFDFGITKLRYPYLVMEYIEGTDLKYILEGIERLEFERFIDIFLQICDALSAAHSKNIIHCDLKPSNVLVTDMGDVKLLDFGLAKILPAKASVSLQATDRFEVCGTPIYMSPEQCAGVDVDKRTDVYALGCMMYECLTGVAPFLGNSAQETFSKHFTFTPPPPSVLCSGNSIPELIDQSILKMLDKSPAQRYQSVDEVTKVLLQFVGSRR